MLILGILILIAIGFIIVNAISVQFSWYEKIGLSFPVGIGVQTLIMAIINLFGIPLTISSIFIADGIFILVLSFLLYKKRNELVTFYKDSFRFTMSGYNLVWIFFIGLILYLEYMNFAKCMYFPTFDRDSLAGFDTIGYVIAQEHTLKHLSLFQSDYMPQINNAGSYITYAPMLQLSYAYVYILGEETSKLVPALMYLSFLVVFYGCMQRVIGKTGAAVTTFFMMITPEMIGFSSLSATNVIHAVSASLGIIYISFWFRCREKKDLYMGSLLLGLNIWTRTDGVVFIGAALLAALIDMIKNKDWKPLLPITASLLPAILWVVFMKAGNFHAESIAIVQPYWDAEKAGIIWNYMKSHYLNTLYYGWTFVVFFISFLVNCRQLIKKQDNMLMLVMIIAASVLYMIALYQIEYKWDSIQNVLAYSAKRFLFCFVPIVWFYSMSNDLVKRLWVKLDTFLS